MNPVAVDTVQTTRYVVPFVPLDIVAETLFPPLTVGLPIVSPEGVAVTVAEVIGNDSNNAQSDQSKVNGRTSVDVFRFSNALRAITYSER